MLSFLICLVCLACSFSFVVPSVYIQDIQGKHGLKEKNICNKLIEEEIDYEKRVNIRLKTTLILLAISTSIILLIMIIASGVILAS